MNRTRPRLMYALLVAGCAVGAACTDPAAESPVVPEAAVSELRGTLVSSLWQFDGKAFEYRGAVSNEAIVPPFGSQAAASHGPGTSVVLSNARIAAIRSGLESRSPFMDRRQAAFVAPNTTSQGRPPILKPAIGATRSISERLPDGRAMRIELRDDERGEGRPARAIAIFVEDRIVSTSDFRYVREGRRWKPLEAVVTYYDSTGRQDAVITTDLSALEPGAGLEQSASASDKLRAGARQIACKLAAIALPSPLSASTMVDACESQRNYVTYASIGVVLAYGAYVAAQASCVASGGIFCPTVIAALSALGLAEAILAQASADLAACLAANSLPSNPPPGAGGGGGCYQIDWYVSYDGGATWTYLYSTIQC